MRKYFHIIPHTLITLPPALYKLYGVISMTCGVNGGVCFKKVSTLAQEVGCSERDISRMVRELSEVFEPLGKPLITAIKSGGGRGKLHEIRLVDVWDENTTEYEKRCQIPHHFEAAVTEKVSNSAPFFAEKVLNSAPFPVGEEEKRCRNQHHLAQNPAEKVSNSAPFSLLDELEMSEKTGLESGCEEGSMGRACIRIYNNNKEEERNKKSITRNLSLSPTGSYHMPVGRDSSSLSAREDHKQTSDSSSLPGEENHKQNSSSVLTSLTSEPSSSPQGEASQLLGLLTEALDYSELRSPGGMPPGPELTRWLTLQDPMSVMKAYHYVKHMSSDRPVKNFFGYMRYMIQLIHSDKNLHSKELQLMKQLDQTMETRIQLCQEIAGFVAMWLLDHSKPESVEMHGEQLVVRSGSSETKVSLRESNAHLLKELLKSAFRKTGVSPFQPVSELIDRMP